MRLAAALLVALAAGSVAAAAPHGRISGRLLTPAGNATAGRTWTATFAVRDGRHPLAGKVSIAAVGELGRWTFAASKAGQAGRYRARITLPAGGAWTLSARSGRRTARIAALDVRGAGPRIIRPHGFELAEDHGDLIVPDAAGTDLYEVNLRTRAKALVAGGFEHPQFLNFGPGGYLYVADERRIYRFEPDGSKTPVAGNGTRGLAGDGGPATAAQLGGHGDFGFDAAGNLYISEYDNGVRIVTTDGKIDTLAGIGREGYSGDGGPARAAAFGAPHGLDVLPDGTVYVADSHNGVIRRIDGATRIVTTVATGFRAPVGIDVRPEGTMYVADAGVGYVVRVAPNGARSSLGSGMNVPSSVTTDRAGNLVYASEYDGRRIRRIDVRTGRMTTILRP
jgi:DNA-binding beta-propeller fold protein YncE